MNLDRMIAVRNHKIVYRDGGLCMKVFDETYSKADILSEALNQARVEATGLHIPPIREVTVIDGKWTIVTDYIKGRILSQLMRAEPEKKNAYLSMFVRLQAEVLEKPCAWLPPLREKLRQKIGQTDLPADTQQALCTLLERLPQEDRLCHGDFDPSNIIIAEDGTPYILDWSHASRGNALADAARSYLLFWLLGDIDGAERYLELFCKQSGVEKQAVQCWMPIVAAAQSVRCNEKTREFLLSWIDTAELKAWIQRSI